MAKLLTAAASNDLYVRLKYDDELEGEINLSKTIDRNSFKELFIRSEFEKVFVNEFTNELCWPSGVRMCANALHKQLELLSLMNRLKIKIDDD